MGCNKRPDGEVLMREWLVFCAGQIFQESARNLRLLLLTGVIHFNNVLAHRVEPVALALF